METFLGLLVGNSLTRLVFFPAIAAIRCAATVDSARVQPVIAVITAASSTWVRSSPWANSSNMHPIMHASNDIRPVPQPPPVDEYATVHNPLENPLPATRIVGAAC